MMLNTDTRKILVAVFWRLGIALLFLAVILFSAAGRWDLPMFWAYFLVCFGVAVLGLRVVGGKDPSLLEERFRPPVRGKDSVTRPMAALTLLISLVIAALDVGRLHWSGHVPLGVQVIGLVVVTATFAVWMWAMSVNRFFSSEVRIQRDRGHQVVTAGPYQFVRHPGYAVAIVLFLTTPIALGSWWAILPIVPLIAVFIRRTALEDRLLRAELEGYAAYAQRVRFQLVPGLW